jgi:hypothetical protein
LAQPGSLARALQDEAFRMSGLEPPLATALTVSLLVPEQVARRSEIYSPTVPI